MAFNNLYEGVSGLNSQMKKMEVIGNNLANLTTAGFKTDRVTFQDLYYDTLQPGSKAEGNIGGINPMQVGTGVDVASIDTIFTQGSRQNTGRELDFMVDGPDFFVVESGATEELLLTRNGAFELDGDLQLVDTAGNHIIGNSYDVNTGAVTKGGITLDPAALNANATTLVDVSKNLDLSSTTEYIDENSQAWAVFSGGENFGNFGIAQTKLSGSKDVYGSGYYGDSFYYEIKELSLLASSSGTSRYVLQSDAYALQDGTSNTEQLSAGIIDFSALESEADSIGEFAQGDIVAITQINDDGKVVQSEAMISQVDTNNNTISFGSSDGTATNLNSLGSYSDGSSDLFISKLSTTRQSGATITLGEAGEADTITVDSTDNIFENDIITVGYVVTADGASKGNYITQDVRVASVEANTITLGESLSSSFSGSNIQANLNGNSITGVSLYVKKTDGFSAGDNLNLRYESDVSNYAESFKITAKDNGLIVLSSDASSELSSDPYALLATNLTNGYDTIGSSGTSNVLDATGVILTDSEGDAVKVDSIGNDVLKSQISVINEFGNLIASFYRVNSNPSGYGRSTATTSSGQSFNVGTGEFTSWSDFKDLVESALDDDELENNQGSQDLNVSIDKFGKITFQGAGQVNDFMFVVNQESDGIRSMLDTFLYEGEATDTQAVLGEDGTVKEASQIEINSSREAIADSTKYWYEVGYDWESKDGVNTYTGIQNYGYDVTAPSTGYAEYGGIRLDGGIGGAAFGRVTVAVTNGLGERKEVTLTAVARDAKAADNQFSTMGDFVDLLERNLQSSDFSSLVSNGALISDSSVSVGIENGRIVVKTSQGSFNNLTITPDNKNQQEESINDGVVETPVELTDQMNFGTLLGDLMYGVNGKTGTSNLFLDPDVKNETIIYDNLGNEHTAVVYFTRDQSQGLGNVEWKTQTSLNPNLNTTVQSNSDDSASYRNTYNSIVDKASRGVLAFDSIDGTVVDGSDPSSDARYSSEISLEFSPLTDNNSVNGGLMDVTFDLNEMTSYNGNSTVTSVNTDGYAFGNLLRIVSEQETGMIKGVYSNGESRTLAQLGLMHIANPGGLEKVGLNNYKQSPNSNPGGNILGLDKVFFLGDTEGGEESLSSTIGSSALESSNVDLTKELTEMIVTQRSYSASGKTITSADQMLQEALNLVR